jgi:diguanylate cyclase (GGDEF)-like protein
MSAADLDAFRDDSWSTDRLTEFLARLSTYDDLADAARFGVQQAVEAVEAEAGALVRDGTVVAAVGLEQMQIPVGEIVAAAAGRTHTVKAGTSSVFRLISAPLEHDGDAQLVVVRRGEALLSNEERGLLDGMARALGLSLRALRLLTGERSLRNHSEQQAREHVRQLDTLRRRQVLLERLGKIQRAIVDRAVLDDVLAAIVSGAGETLSDPLVALRLIDLDEPEWMTMRASQGIEHRPDDGVERNPISEGLGGRAIREQRLVIAHDYSSDPSALPYFRQRGVQAAMSAPIYEGAQVVGSLTVATYRPGRRYTLTEQEVLQTLAEHVGLALTDAKNFEAAVHRAYHDMLTGLPNRALFLDRLGHSIRRSERTGRITAVLFLDLDGFKRVNDSLGHSAGDQLLIEVAARLEDCLRPADTAARFGGDEFAVLLEDLERGADATMVASRIMASLQEPVMLLGRRVTVSASIGVALDREHGDDLLRNADLAMYRAKSLGKNRYEIFDPALNSVVMERLQLEAELQRAVENDEFRLQFQPIVRIEGGVPAAVEALVRWQHPERGLLYPNDFIPVAEETKLISAIGRWVLNESCRQAVRWQESYRGTDPVAISVNLSVTQLEQPGLIYEVAEALERSGLNPQSLILEVTETLLMDNVDLMGDTLDGLKRLGVQLAVDDFGTGYSSLQYLQRFPIDILKIAKAFVDDIATAGPSSLARVIIDLGQSLGLRVIAEGIELPEQVATLLDMGCRWGQGFYFARPVDAAEFEKLLDGAEYLEGWPPRSAPELATRSAVETAPGAAARS